MDVRTICIGILDLGDATGYEIKKLVADGAFSFFSEASYGSIYPALSKLMEDGLVTCREEAQDGKPDKKIYSLTEQGRTELTGALQKDPGPDRQRSEFLASLLFAEAVSPERVNQLIDDRIEHHLERIHALRNMSEAELTPASAFVLGYGLSVQQAALDYLKTNKSSLLGKPNENPE